jgi:hypothetical protein
VHWAAHAHSCASLIIVLTLCSHHSFLNFVPWIMVYEDLCHLYLVYRMLTVS